jgi:hypothetical protein
MRVQSELDESDPLPGLPVPHAAARGSPAAAAFRTVTVTVTAAVTQAGRLKFRVEPGARLLDSDVLLSLEQLVQERPDS